MKFCEFLRFLWIFLPSFASSRRMYIRLRVAKRRFSPKSDYPQNEADSNLHLRQPPFLLWIRLIRLASQATVSLRLGHRTALVLSTPFNTVLPLRYPTRFAGEGFLDEQCSPLQTASLRHTNTSPSPLVTPLL